ncbi:hypothetical protein CEXT_152681 [Caerostris extrusa]|uniref:LAGLIDADG homing endonuclease n=1 Tax=Caerostris extrusa TaxID=172846 RepID=A0AAV4Y9R3_CAEEX|nr:hypothetical protein CEXT_152681 [Caerostris extrusa]
MTAGVMVLTDGVAEWNRGKLFFSPKKQREIPLITERGRYLCWKLLSPLGFKQFVQGHDGFSDRIRENKINRHSRWIANWTKRKKIIKDFRPLTLDLEKAGVLRYGLVI